MWTLRHEVGPLELKAELGKVLSLEGQTEVAKLAELDGQDIPAEFIENERFAFIKGTPKVLATPYKFAQHGESGASLSELLPHTASIADKRAVTSLA